MALPSDLIYALNTRIDNMEARAYRLAMPLWAKRSSVLHRLLVQRHQPDRPDAVDPMCEWCTCPNGCNLWVSWPCPVILELATVYDLSMRSAPRD